MPHGRFVGGPYSSWLKKLPHRPIACITNRPGRDHVRPAQNDTCQRRMTSQAAIVPVMIPP